MCNKAVFPQQYVTVIFVPVMYSSVSRTRCASLLYQLTFCTGLAVLSLQHRRLTRCFHSVLCNKYCKWPYLKTFQNPSCGPRVKHSTWQTVCLLVLAAHLSAAVTVGGVLGDTINGPDRFVYWMECKWRRLFLCAVNVYCVSSCLCLSCIVNNMAYCDL